jgi:hypothetical protein
MNYVSNNKKEFLDKLEIVIDNNKIIRHDYEMNGCHCAVGHVFKICGIDMPNDMDNGTTINALDYPQDKIPVDRSFLAKLQSINDSGFYKTMTERKMALINLIREEKEREEA